MIVGHAALISALPGKPRAWLFGLLSVRPCLVHTSMEPPEDRMAPGRPRREDKCLAFIESARPGVSASVPYGRAYRSLQRPAKTRSGAADRQIWRRRDGEAFVTPGVSNSVISHEPTSTPPAGPPRRGAEGVFRDRPRLERIGDDERPSCSTCVGGIRGAGLSGCRYGSQWVANRAQRKCHGAPACIACHGEQLKGDAALKTPALAGLPAEFILSRLAHYSGPQGHNAMMRQVATALSPEERQAVATYLASLTASSGPPQ